MKEITASITLLSQSDTIVLQEDDLQAISYHRIIINNVSNWCDQLDDHLSSVVTWSCLQVHTNISMMHLNNRDSYAQLVYK